MLIPSALNPSHRGSPVRPKNASQAVRTSAPRRRYFLEVQIQVPATEQERFTKLGNEFIENFKDEHLTLTVSTWRTDIGPIFAVNYWDMGSDANTLLEAELALPDVAGFNAFNAIVQSEIKNIVVPIAGDEFVPVPVGLKTANGKLPHEGYRYLRVVVQVSIENLPEFVARIESHIKSFTTAAGWYLGDTYLGITGREGSVSQLWLIPATDTLRVARQLQGAAWLQQDVIEEPPAFQVMRATHSDPTLEQSGDEA